ncbi:putative P450 monooxygenase [Aureobasidium sp. EXF-10727]|nr:putative P450 monooxygenase [Aureobasidium sp. EXF-10727]KAI4725735.1 putative P450 monooxygenase [Aureobasidium sp. EXF-10728]
MLTLFVLVAIPLAAAYYFLIEPLYLNPKSKIPGPTLYALSKWRLALEDYRGNRTRAIQALHEEYGPIVRIGPNEIHCNNLDALRTIYGAGSGFERTWFYRMFDAYGRQNLFTFYTTKAHSDRKKLVANAYSKSLMLNGPAARMVQEKVASYMALIEAKGDQPHEIFSSLHYFSIDAITHFLYGSSFGGTSALKGNVQHRALLNDIVDPTRRYLSWFAVHFPTLTKWMYTREGLTERILKPLLPMQKPTTYTGIRKHALEAYHSFESAAKTNADLVTKEPSIVSRLWNSHKSVNKSGRYTLDSLDIASECADHLLAGIDTTADSLMFLIWALSRRQNAHIQKRLAEEVLGLPGDAFENNMPKLDVIDKLPYLNAVIKETLRLYAPLPASEPRSIGSDCIISGYKIPARTVVNMSPYSLHRNPDVFDKPLEFNPERWCGESDQVALMNRWFWAFSSGGRMCIGLHLAMAEMTALTVAVYRDYNTSIAPGFENKSPAITSRFELFYDVTLPQIADHECMITFTKAS